MRQASYNEAYFIALSYRTIQIHIETQCGFFETESSPVQERMYPSKREPQGPGTIKVVGGKMEERKINFVLEGKSQTRIL